jgi:enamine deaminase RidA (YjgF/YER057c/UK114 family)
MRYRADYGPIRSEFFGPKMPPHTLVGVASLAAPEFLIEIEAVAVL